jgi:hypothetical protein
LAASSYNITLALPAAIGTSLENKYTKKIKYMYIAVTASLKSGQLKED